MDEDKYLKGYRIGIEHGKRDMRIEMQKSNKNTDLPSNETLYKIFGLLFEIQEIDIKTSSCYINTYEHYANYITEHWNDAPKKQ